MKTEYLSAEQIARLVKECPEAEVRMSSSGANIRFIHDGKLVYARVDPEVLNRALFRQRQPEISENQAGGNT